MDVIKRSEMKRFADLAARLVTDQVVPGVRDLYQALLEERARRFVSHLNATSQSERNTAEREIRALATSADGESVLMRIARECLLGTERISLAAMAVIVSCDNLASSDKAAIAASIEGLSDTDAVSFLSLLSRPTTRRSVKSSWCPEYAIDCTVALTPDWEGPRVHAGVDDQALFSCMAECERRRILLPSPSRSRLGNETDIAPRYFCTSSRTLAIYEVIYRALAIVDKETIQVCAIMTIDAIRLSWPAGQTSGEKIDSPG